MSKMFLLAGAAVAATAIAPPALAATYLVQITGASTALFTVTSDQLRSANTPDPEWNGGPHPHVGMDGIVGFFSGRGRTINSAGFGSFLNNEPPYTQYFRIGDSAGLTTALEGARIIVSDSYTDYTSLRLVTGVSYAQDMDFATGDYAMSRIQVTDVTGQTVYLFTVKGATDAAYALTSDQLAAARSSAGGLAIDDVPGYYSWNTGVGGSSANLFFSSGIDGLNPPLYTRGPAGVGFSPGTYDVKQWNGGVDRVTVSILSTAAAAAVPEPATWAMMLLGFGAVGGAVRRRRASIRFATA